MVQYEYGRWRRAAHGNWASKNGVRNAYAEVRAIITKERFDRLLSRTATTTLLEVGCGRTGREFHSVRCPTTAWSQTAHAAFSFCSSSIPASSPLELLRGRFGPSSAQLSVCVSPWKRFADTDRFCAREARNHFFEGGRFDEMLGFGELLVAAVLILYVLLPLTVIGLFTQALRFTRTRDKRV